MIPTSTPIINGLQDAYAYVRFLKIRPWYDWDDFNHHIALLEKKNREFSPLVLSALLTTEILQLLSL
jgi:SNF2-related domain